MENNVATKLEDLNLVDKFLFDEVMEDLESYEALISILLENEIHLLTRPETEKELRVSPQLRQVRLDVVSMDRGKKVYYTEMQKTDTGNLRKRSRLYQAQLDVSLLEPGTTNFNLLSNSCFILIAPFDIFGKGLCRYTFEGTCRECPELRLGDGAMRVFINTQGTNREEFSQEFLDLMEYITDSTDMVAELSKSKRLKQIHRSVRKIKLSEKMGVKYMQKWEELAYAREEGAEIGEKIHLIKLVCKKLAKGKVAETIAAELEEDVEIVAEICRAAEDSAPDYDFDRIYEKVDGTRLTASAIRAGIRQNLV